jgi:hypothetical protein
MRIVGIDPGQTGAVACFSSHGEIAVHDLPTIADRSIAWIDGAQLQSLLIGEPAIVIIERVSAMPKQGVASSFKFGMSFGSILSVVQAVGHRIELVTPATWKRELGLGSDKKAALHKARLLFPQCELHLEKHDGRAEALLIGHWYLTRARSAAA